MKIVLPLAPRVDTPRDRLAEHPHGLLLVLAQHVLLGLRLAAAEQPPATQTPPEARP